MKPSGWRAVKNARLVRKQWQSRNPAPLTDSCIHRGRSVWRGSVEPLFFCCFHL
nr:MAG TPA: hypothetical protein [Caudoviricetes sp.]